MIHPEEIPYPKDKVLINSEWLKSPWEAFFPNFWDETEIINGMIFTDYKFLFPIGSTLDTTNGASNE